MKHASSLWWRAWPGTRLLCNGVRIGLALGAMFLATPGRSAQALQQFDEASLARDGAVLVQRGVFRIDGDGQVVTPLCIPVQGRWRQVGTQRDCGADPPAEQQREIIRFNPDITFLGVRNLGVTKEQLEAAWGRGPAKRSAGTTLRQIGEAFSFSISATDTRWRFDSAKLPTEIKADIPGSGIHVHFGGLFSDARRIPVLEDGAGLEIEARLAMPVLRTTGRAHSGLTLAADLDLPTVGGGQTRVPVIVNLLRESDRGKEHVASDGRTSYVTTWLAPGSRYVESVVDPQETEAFRSPERFVIRFTARTLGSIAQDMNRQRAGKGAAIDTAALAQSKLSGVTVRNELRFLDKGDVSVEVVVDYLRISRATGGR